MSNVINAGEMFAARRIAGNRCGAYGYQGPAADRMIRNAALLARDQPAIAAVSQAVPAPRRRGQDWTPPGAA